jgi:hypothetical protein
VRASECLAVAEFEDEASTWPDDNGGCDDMTYTVSPGHRPPQPPPCKAHARSSRLLRESHEFTGTIPCA